LRTAAIRVVGRLYQHRAGDPPLDQKLSNAVIAAVNERDRTVKLAAMDALGAVRDARAIDGLTQLFQFYGKGDLAEAALAALARIGNRVSAPIFLLQLESKSTPMKVMGIEGLARTGDASHMGAIQAALKRERDDRVIDAADFAAGMLSNAPIEQLVDALNRPKSHDAARQYLIEIAPGRVSRMSRYAQDPTPRVRVDVADIVGASDDPQGIPIVAPLLADKDQQVAMAAARATLRLRYDGQ
jgi:HEAT repeat protein